MILNDESRPGMSFLLLSGATEDMILVRQDINSSIEVLGERTAEIPEYWLAPEEAEEQA
jgi:hypothetical protein